MSCKANADAVDHLASETKCEVEEDPIEYSSDVENCKQGECYSGSEFEDKLYKLYGE